MSRVFVRASILGFNPSLAAVGVVHVGMSGAMAADKILVCYRRDDSAGHAGRLHNINDRQTRNAPEVSRIDRQHGVAERERRRTDNEIGEWNHDLSPRGAPWNR
jgi:hypothetical protein